ncbi:MAG: hypothetical protein RLZZ522_1241 [Verrucomicrobiota bacterium]
MSTHSSLILSGLVGAFALVSCTSKNPYDTGYDTGYDPYRRPAQPRPPYGATPNPAPYGSPQNPGAVGNPPSSVDPYGQPPGPTPYGQVQPPNVPEPTKYPTAERTQTPGIVVCPFDPNRQIDVSEFKSGDLARDRETKQIFRVP